MRRALLFDGPDYSPERDDWRLSAQHLRIFTLMRDGIWRTLHEIAQATKDPEPSISAQLRHLRKERFGAHTINKRYLREGLYEYQLIMNDHRTDLRRPRTAEEPSGPQRILLCVDLSYQVYRASAAHPTLTSKRVFTGGLYGFLTTFAKTVRETGATDVAFCQDVKPYRRSADYPEYKQWRKKNADDELLKMYTSSMSLVLGTLQCVGQSVWGVPGFESDDLIAHCVRKYRNRFTKIYAASNDSDLWQLLWCRNFFIYRDSITNLMDGDRLARELKLTPDQFMLATALSGTHNDIEGIAGVGEKRSRDAARDPALLRGYREKHGALIDRNLALIKLPHPEFPSAAAIPQRHADFNARAFYRSMALFDIDVTVSMERAFQQIQGAQR